MALIRHDSDRAFLDQGGTWDEENGGTRVINWIEKNLCLETGAQFKVMPWMHDVIHSWYSWFEPTGLRRVTRGVLTCGRKQAKSILSFGLTAWHLVSDGEAARCATCACNKEQAAQIFDWLAIAIDRNPNLKKALHPVPSKKVIEYPRKHGRYRSLASDSKGGNLGHGYSFLAFDEMAFFSRNDELYHLLKNSTDARRGMQILISTAGFNKNCAFYREIQTCRKILDGSVIDTQTQPWIFEVPDGREDDESAWILGCPSLGVTQSIEDLRQQWEREKRDATTRHTFQVLKFNQQKDADNVWVPVEDFDQCQAALPTLDGRDCVLGVDIGSRDLTAISAVFPLEGKRYAVKCWNFVPEAALKTRDGSNAVLYQTFQKSGSLTVTPGEVIDEHKLMAFLDTLRQRFKVKAVIFDKWQSNVLSNHCKKHGITNFNFPQYHTYYNAPCIEFERLVNRRQILHDGDPCLRWQVGHTYLDTDNKGYKKPITSRPENKKDSLCALLMALSQVLQHESKPSVYESRKLLCV